MMTKISQVIADIEAAAESARELGDVETFKGLTSLLGVLR